MSIVILVRSLVIVFLFLLLSGCAHDEHHSMNHNMDMIATGFDCSTIDNSLNDIKHRYDLKKVTSNKCHMDTHMLTRQIVSSCGIDVAQKHISYQCRSAMVHGIMEGFAITNSGSVTLADDMLSFCNTSYDAGSLYRSECVHGIGNGFIVINGLDVIKSISQCKFLKDHKLVNICVSGVYGGFFRYDLTKDRDGSFCNGKQYESICRNYVGSYFDEKTDTEFSRCKSAKDKNNCGFGLGVMYSRSIDNNIDRIISICKTKSCLQGAIWEAKRVEKDDIANDLTTELLN